MPRDWARPLYLCAATTSATCAPVPAPIWSCSARRRTYIWPTGPACRWSARCGGTGNSPREDLQRPESREPLTEASLSDEPCVGKGGTACRSGRDFGRSGTMGVDTGRGPCMYEIQGPRPVSRHVPADFSASFAPLNHLPGPGTLPVLRSRPDHRVARGSRAVARGFPLCHRARGFPLAR